MGTFVSMTNGSCGRVRHCNTKSPCTSFQCYLALVVSLTAHLGLFNFKSDINIYFYIDIFDTISRKRSLEPKDAKGIFGSDASTQLYDHLIVHLTVSQKKTNLGKCYCTALILGPGANRKRVLHKYVSFPLNWEKMKFGRNY